MRAEEFDQWVSVWERLPLDGDEISYFGQLAQRAMEAEVEILERAPGSSLLVAAEYADAIRWAAFWIALGAVICTAVVVFA